MGLEVSSGGAVFATLMTHPMTPAPAIAATAAIRPSVRKTARWGPLWLRRFLRCRSRRDIVGGHPSLEEDSPHRSEPLFPLPVPRARDSGLTERPQGRRAQRGLAREALRRGHRRPRDEHRDARLGDVRDPRVARVLELA